MNAHSVCHAVLCTILLLLTSKVLADDKSDKAPSAEEMEMMKKWEAAATPGPEHKALEPLVGEWSIASKTWMSPEAPPMETKGSTKTRWILGGRFLQDDYEGEFMGKAMQGLGLTGYDNLKKKYTGLWIDSGGTAMFTSTGKASKNGKTFTFTGRMDDPMTGEKNKPLKYTIKIISDDKHIFEMFDTSGGKSVKMIEMVYTRK